MFNQHDRFCSFPSFPDWTDWASLFVTTDLIANSSILNQINQAMASQYQYLRDKLYKLKELLLPLCKDMHGTVPSYLHLSAYSYYGYEYVWNIFTSII